MAAELDKRILLDLAFTPLFAGLVEDDVRLLVADARILTLPHEHELYREGQPIEDFYVVLDGHVELSVEVEDGRRSIIEVARKGMVLADAAMFSGKHFLFSARVLTGARVLAIPAAPFRTTLEQRLDIALHLLSTMSVRLRMLVRQIAELKLKSTAQRLGSFLLSLSGRHDGTADVRFPYDKKLVAGELGMKPESLSRALAKLGRLGVEPRPDNTVHIADVARLREFCSEDDQG